ncbi:SANT/Myb_domain [Hexamita inflata]|uniref:SANT/Myb domain n=1 Tax=Hexamita inflata TaxID=28002 RepID=A0AA86U326_9EUKA|nr:SANT/Myb domain [Hexamita inflata]
MQNQVHSLMQKFQQMLISNPKQVLYEIMMLPDGAYHYLLTEMSTQMSIPPNELKLHFSEAVTQQFRIIDFNKSHISNNGDIQKKSLKDQYAEQRHAFAKQLANVLQENNIISDTFDHKQMCIDVDTCIQEHGQKIFWKSMQKLIPYKTVKQLRDYYHRSFQQVLYNCHISFEDKQILQKLMNTYPSERPSSIAHHFMQEYAGEERGYSHRNIVVYIINSRRK